MRSSRPSDRAHPVWGWFCIVLGLYAVAIAAELLPADAAALQAPMWVIFLCGLVFLLGGAMMLIDRNSKLNALCASLLLLVMGVIGAWVALLGPAAGFSGGIPFLPHAYNVTLARWVFGLGALVSFMISIYAIRTLLTPRA
jgi:hypothetical protein